MSRTTTSRTRLYSPVALTGDSELWLAGKQAKYVSRVLRLRKNESVTVFDGQGGQFPAVIKELERNRVLIRLGTRIVEEVESSLAIHLIQGMSRGGRMDIVIQKSTELGVRRITPVIMEHSVVRLDANKAERRREHWMTISQSACEQCGRNTLPEIDIPQSLQDCLTGFRQGKGLKIMLDPRSSESISALPVPDTSVTLLIGPEGGITEAEADNCAHAGFQKVGLGPRILRTETAALAGIAILQARWGDLR